MSFKTPYSNMHELNLDWIMKAIKNLFGGTGGQYLRKKSNTQFDYEWHTITPSDIGALPDSYTPPVTSVAGKTGDVTLDSQDVSFDRSENYTEPSIGAELNKIENIVKIPNPYSPGAGTPPLTIFVPSADGARQRYGYSPRMIHLQFQRLLLTSMDHATEVNWMY